MSRCIFNPEHDLCLASGEENFIPPAPVQAFASAGKWIEKYMSVPQAYPFAVMPWGWNSCIKKKLLMEGYTADKLPPDSFLNFIREHSRRELAVDLLDSMQGESIIPSTYRVVARSMEKIESFVQQKGRIVLKSPLSGSGKGIRFVSGELMETDRGWCRRTLQKQGAVIVEQRKEVVQECAMLFECGGEVKFRGYSMFYAHNGAYKGNLLASDDSIERILGEYVAVEELRYTRDRILDFLQEKLQGRYWGYVGVDQFIFAEGGKYLLNPAVEINLRMTMGLIARNIFDYHSKEFDLGNGTHCFEPLNGVILCD